LWWLCWRADPGREQCDVLTMGVAVCLLNWVFEKLFVHFSWLFFCFRFKAGASGGCVGNMEEGGNDGDNLTNNLFLQVLRSKFQNVWNKAEEDLLFICVPAAGSFAGVVDITREVVESHVMREKLFVGRFETLNGREVKLEGYSCLEFVF
jgi:hypothetical protein